MAAVDHGQRRVSVGSRRTHQSCAPDPVLVRSRNDGPIPIEQGPSDTPCTDARSEFLIVPNVAKRSHVRGCNRQ